MIGAGALGCEFLKMFSLMGVSSSPKSNLYCTDDDNIAVNLFNIRLPILAVNFYLEKTI